MEHEYRGRGDNCPKQGWTRILATDQVGRNGNNVCDYLIYQIREDWSSSQLLSPEIGQNEGIFSFRGFMGPYQFRFLLDGEEFGDGMEVELMEDLHFSCDFSDGFDEHSCTGI